MSSINLPRLSTRMQSNAISYGAHQLASGQRAVRRPTIGAPEIMLTTQPTANLKRRSHIRRTSRSGNSPTTPPGNESSSPSGSRPNRPQPLPLTTAFTRSITTSVSSGSVLTRQPTVIEYSAVEWRDSPQYQPKVTSKTDVSRKSTMASVYSLPSALPHDSRRPTQENFILDWSVIDRALQNRVESPTTSPHHPHSQRDHLHRSSSSISQHPIQRVGSRSRSTPVDLSRSNTTQVHSLLIDRQRRRNVVSEALE